MTKPLKNKKALEKEPKSIFEQESDLKNKAKQLSSSNNEQESKKLCDGYTWVQVDSRTRKLVKTNSNGKE
jgi:hypothetical protein